MTWLEIIYESLQYGLIAYFVHHAYRNSQDVSELKAKMITMRGRFEQLEASYNLAKKNHFYCNRPLMQSYSIKPEQFKTITQENQE